MTRYTDLGRVPGAWRDASIASAASTAIRSHGYYDPGCHGGPSPSFIPANASGSVSVHVTPRTCSEYESLRSESERVSRALVNGTATRADVESYNARARAFSSRNPLPSGT